MKSALRWLCIVVTFLPPLVAAEALPEGLVRETQFLLMEKGYNPGPIDGIYGEKTGNAILSYERKYHLPLTGSPTYDLVSRLHMREGTESQLNEPKQEELSGKIDNMQRELTDIKQERAFLSKELVKMRKDFQRGENFQAQKHDLINIGSDIVTDVLGLFIGVMALVAVAIFFWLKQIVTDRALRALEAEEKKLRYGLYVDLSGGLYTIYRRHLDGSAVDMFSLCVHLALYYSEEAIKVATQLPEKDLDKEHMLMYALQHKAYHQTSAVRLSLTNRASALMIVPHLREHSHKLYKACKRHWVDCTETLAWILVRCGTEEQRQEGITIVKALLLNDQVSPSLREEFKENYFRAENLDLNA